MDRTETPASGESRRPTAIPDAYSHRAVSSTLRKTSHEAYPCTLHQIFDEGMETTQAEALIFAFLGTRMRAGAMHITDALRGGLGLAFDAVEGVTDIVEGMHHNIAVRPGSPGKRPQGRAPGIAGLVYACVRGVNGALRGSVDASFALAQVASPGHRGEPSHESWIAALNGVLGDHLERTGNPLAIPMRLRIGGRALELSRDGIRAATQVPSQRILILVHGLCMNDLQWTRARDEHTSHNHGHALATAFGYAPVWLHYNSGRHVSTNGREFSKLVERLIDAWPTPVHSITLLGHSMGGLVIRSALHVASEARAAWFPKVDRAVYLGTPHHGAVLERAGNRLQAGVAWSRYSAPFAGLGAIRSAGITDLRHGNVLDADWRGVDRFDCHGDRRRRAPLTAGPDHYAIAATLSPQPGTAGRGPGAVIGRLLGDGLVHPSSATGRHRDPERTLAFAYDHVRTFYGLGHLELLSSAEVYAQLASWLGTRMRRSSRNNGSAAGGIKNVKVDAGHLSYATLARKLVKLATEPRLLVAVRADA